MNPNWPEIPIGPILEALGCDNVPDDDNWRPIKCVNPKHADNNASASTNGFGYKCHGCGLKGNAITVVMEVNECERSSAIRFIEDVSGGSLPEVSRKPVTGRRRVFDGGERANTRNDKRVSPRVRKRPFAGS